MLHADNEVKYMRRENVTYLTQQAVECYVYS